MPDLVSARVENTPHAIALVADSERLTYGELDTRSNQLASHLRSVSVGPEIPVALCVERSPAFVIGALGILRAGGAYVPLDPDYPPDRLAFMLNDTQAPVLIAQESTCGRLPARNTRVIRIDADWPKIASGGCSSPDSSGARPENLAYIIYTSGSTGRPKGVEITHGSLLNLVAWHQGAFAVTSGDRASQLASIGFDAAVWEVWPYLASGASLHFVDETTRKAPQALRDWLVKQGITIAFVPTALAEQLMALDWPRETALRMLLTGADTLHHYPPASLPFTVVNNYGPTECTVVATSGPVLPDARQEGLPTIGRPIANTQVHILNERMEQVPAGAEGELYIGGAGVARGYRNLPQLTHEKFVPDPFSAERGARVYKSGDMGRYLPGGQIAFLGRIDEQIKIRGFRIEPAEIVAVLNQHAGIQASAVIAREDTPGDKRLVAYIVAKLNGPPADDLPQFLRERLPDYMLPSTLVPLERLPITPNGKLDHSALPMPIEQAPGTQVSQRLVRILSGLLGIEEVGMEDNFFMLGGHSLLGAQLVARVRDTFGVEITLRSLFEAPTIERLSVEIERLYGQNCRTAKA